jgi:hypothetical protein
MPCCSFAYLVHVSNGMCACVPLQPLATQENLCVLVLVVVVVVPTFPCNL